MQNSAFSCLTHTYHLPPHHNTQTHDSSVILSPPRLLHGGKTALGCGKQINSRVGDQPAESLWQLRCSSPLSFLSKLVLGNFNVGLMNPYETNMQQLRCSCTEYRSRSMPFIIKPNRRRRGQPEAVRRWSSLLNFQEGVSLKSWGERKGRKCLLIWEL